MEVHEERDKGWVFDLVAVSQHCEVAPDGLCVRLNWSRVIPDYNPGQCVPEPAGVPTSTIKFLDLGKRLEWDGPSDLQIGLQILDLAV